MFAALVFGLCLLVFFFLFFYFTAPLIPAPFSNPSSQMFPAIFALIALGDLGFLFLFWTSKPWARKPLRVTERGVSFDCADIDLLSFFKNLSNTNRRVDLEWKQVDSISIFDYVSGAPRIGVTLVSGGKNYDYVFHGAGRDPVPAFIEACKKAGQQGKISAKREIRGGLSFKKARSL